MKKLPVFLLLLVPAAAGAQARAVDLVVRNGTVVTVDGARRVIPSGAVAVEAGRIVAVGPASEVDAAYRGRDVLDAKGGIVIPGLINAHNAPPGPLRGIADDLRPLSGSAHIFPA